MTAPTLTEARKTDSKVVLAVTAALALMAVVGLGGIIYLTAVGRDIPDSLTAVTSAASGAIAALLARTSVG